MERINEITPVFVETIDKELEQGILYVSKKYGCAIHLCACGCGEKSVTPFNMESEKDGYWKYTETNGKVTLHPSIGNFNGEKPYHAHYYIQDNKIVWC